MAENRREDAVSPVIGTILLVAVTVILAAIIGSYVFGAPQNVTKAKVIGATAQLDITGVIFVTYQGGQGDAFLSSLSITAPNSTISTYANPNVGAVMKLIQPLPPNDDWPTVQKHVVVVAAFTDGPEQVILDTYL